MKIEYRVNRVERYEVTRYEDNGNTGSVGGKGEYGNAHIAYEVGYALCKAEHERLGWPVDDERIRYPDDPACAVGPSKKSWLPVSGRIKLPNGQYITTVRADVMDRALGRGEFGKAST